MKCPVCKTECGEADKCPTCGFDQLRVEFLNKEEVVNWENNAIVPFRQKYEYKLLRLTNRYGHWGLRRQWLYDYLIHNDNNFINSIRSMLGTRQYYSFINWIEDSDINNPFVNIQIRKIFDENGIDSIHLWGILWCNLSQNSNLIKWYCIHIKPNTVFRRNDIEVALGDQYSFGIRHDIALSLIDMFSQTPLGDKLLQCSSVENRKYISAITFSRNGFNDVPPALLLYSMFQYIIICGNYREYKTDEYTQNYYSISLSDLLSYPTVITPTAISPIVVWGLSIEDFKKKISTLVYKYSEYIDWQFDLFDGDVIEMTNYWRFIKSFDNIIYDKW